MINTIVPTVLLLAMVAILLIQSRQIRDLANRVAVQKEVSISMLKRLAKPEEAERILDEVKAKYQL